MSLSARERKQLQRQKDKAEGWKIIELKINPAYEDEIRRFASMLPAPNRRLDPRQLDIIEYINLQIQGKVGPDRSSVKEALVDYHSRNS